MNASRPAGTVSRVAVAELRLHPQARLVPAMTELEWGAFRADVAANGIGQPLEITRDGLVLDGRHRLRAAAELGLIYVPVQIVETSNPVEYMVRSALQRRQLVASQRAALAIELLALDEPVRVVATLPPGRGRVREIAAELAGVSPRTLQDALTVRARDRGLFERVLAGEIPAHRARLQLEQRERYAAIGPTPPLPDEPFEVIYADPPWQLGNPDSAYAPEQHYPTLPSAEIAALPIPAAEDALLYLWAVSSHLPDGLEVMAAWGFAYRGCEVWVKPSIGMGVWTRNKHELLLIGRKGNASPAPRKLLLDSVIEAARGRHSEKPAIVYERLEHLYPGRSKLELFARGRPRPGWTAWGNQVDEAAA